MSTTAATQRPHAVITGASAGLGRAFAQALAKGQHDLSLVARDRERLTSLAQELEATYGVQVTVFPADLSNDAETSRVVDYLTKERVDVLVNSAGFVQPGRLGTIDAARQDAMVRLHVLAVHRLTQAVLPAMLQRQSGSIIIVSSTASYLTSYGNVNYCATKAYERFLAEGLSREVQDRGVYVQALCPGYIRTELHPRAGVSRRGPEWLWWEPEEVAQVALDAMQRRRPTVVVPGWFYRLVTFAVRFSPRWVQSAEAKLFRRMR